MADSTFNLEIVTPEKVLFSEDVASFEAPGKNGEFQVLSEHTPFLTGLRIGTISYSMGGKKNTVSISGGFCEVRPEKAVILAHTAETADMIDVERAQKARDRAQERLESGKEDIDEARAKAALDRALNRLRVAGTK